MCKQLIFCTLFGCNYLDKGLVMYNSLVSTGCNFKLYVLPMDDKCKDALNNYNYKHINVLNFNEFVSKYNLDVVKKTRGFGVFCWTCTPFLIDFVLSNYNEPIATYIDADLYFYSDPSCLINEMNDKTVQIVPHRYNPSLYGNLVRKKAGTYCVQFNTFKNSEDALSLLHWWCKQCYRHCSSDLNGVLGDQGYLENWEKNKNVTVLKHMGGGVAPWNLAQYKLDSNNIGNLNSLNEKFNIFLLDKYKLDRFPLIFFHYQGIRYLSEHCAQINVYEPWKVDVRLVNLLYIDYLKKIHIVKRELKLKFGIYYVLRKHPTEDNTLLKKRKFYDYVILFASLFFPKQFYFKIIFRFLNRLFSNRNIIRF